VAFARCPLICNPPPLVLDSSHLTLIDLGEKHFLASSDLPPACQVHATHAAAARVCETATTDHISDV
jgi:hypothetical protein